MSVSTYEISVNKLHNSNRQSYAAEHVISYYSVARLRCCKAIVLLSPLPNHLKRNMDVISTYAIL